MSVLIMKITTHIEQITPEKAEMWLEGNNSNRKMRISWVKELVAIIKRGEWKITNDAITFDTKGRLLNGQHRLAAILMSGETVESIIFNNADTDSFSVMDTGKRRSLSDLTGMNRRVSEVVRLAAEYLYGAGLKNATAKQVEPIMNSRIFSVAERLVSCHGTARKVYSSAPVKLAAVISICGGLDEDTVFRIYSSLIRYDLDDMTPAAKLIFKQVESGKVSVRANYNDVFARFLKVFKAGNAIIPQLTVTDVYIESSRAYAKAVILNAVQNNRSNK